MANRDQSGAGADKTIDKTIGGAQGKWMGQDIGQALAAFHRNFETTIQANRALHDGLVEVVRRQGAVISEFMETSENAMRELTILGMDTVAQPKRTEVWTKLVEEWLSHTHEIAELMASAQVNAIAALNTRGDKDGAAERAAKSAQSR